MRQHQDRRASELPRRQQPGRPDGSSATVRTARSLQRAAGNAALASALQRLAAQRQGGAQGGQGQDQAAPNPVVAALWDTSVQAPIHRAADAMSDLKPDYRTAFDSAGQAESALESVLGSLPTDDPRKPKGNYLIDDLTLVQTLLAPRANIPIKASDDDVAAKLGGMEYDAQVVGESMGARPAPRQIVNPRLEQEIEAARNNPEL
jgi:hypothetical protein